MTKRTMRPNTIGIVLLLIGAASLVPAWADTVYRWTDASGQVHFSQTPPTSGHYDVMQGARATPSAPSAAASAAAEDQRARDKRFLEEAEAARKAKAEAKEKEQTAKAEKDQRCKLVRETKHALEERHAYVGMNVEEFTRRMEEIRKDEAAHCN